MTRQTRLSLALPRWLAAATLIAVTAWVGAAPSGTSLQDAENIVHMLDYVSVDYPEFVQDGQVLDPAEYQEQLEFASQVRTLLEALPQTAQQPGLVAQAAALKRRIEAKAPGEEVSRLAANLRWAVIDAYHLTVTPKRAPDLSRARALYAEHCARCHGAQGGGDGAAAAGLDPPPSNFHDQARMASRSLYGLYNTITLGVAGTAMTGFRHFSEEDRWALAFHVAGMGVDPTLLQKGMTLWRGGVGRNVFSGLKPLATLTRKEVAEKHGEEAAAVMAWLAVHPEALEPATGSPIAESRRLLAESVEAYRRGDRAEALRRAVSAYLEGFELAEASLDAVASGLRVEVENAMTGYRSLLRAGAPASEVERRAAEIDALLVEAQNRLGGDGLSPTAAAVSAFVILLREGLEAILVLAAVIAFLVKAERRDLLKYVHAGWIGALFLGLATWAVASELVKVSGAGRELTEGITALLAAAILLYVGFWLHSKAHAHAWKAFIEQRLKGALSRGTASVLVAVAFLAVYREVFETVLFYQALWAQTGDTGGGSITVGFLTATAALIALSWAVFRYGVRLPVGPFFTVSSTLLALLAVVFVGQGVAALQEAGSLPADLVAFPRVPVLGIYPTVQTLTAQVAALLLVIAGFFWLRRAHRKHPGNPPADA